MGGRGHYEIGLFFLGGGVISIQFRAFKGQDTEWEYFFGPQNFKYFWVCLIFLIFFFFFFFFFLGGGGGVKQ